MRSNSMSHQLISFFSVWEDASPSSHTDYFSIGISSLIFFYGDSSSNDQWVDYWTV